MSPPAGFLEPDLAQLDRFVRGIYRHADEGTYVSLRSFEHNAGTKPFAVETVRINGDLGAIVRVAAHQARRAANNRKPIVFAPPIATFANPDHAAEADLANGVALSVECDADPAKARKRLEGLLGRATYVVASGGIWIDPTSGEIHDKLHLHWVLNEPTRAPDAHARLKLGRKLATLLIGGDPTAVPTVHPLRCPGSWHRKGQPRLCHIIGGDERAELDLGDALDRLDVAVKAAGISLDKAKANGSSSEDRDTAELVRLVTTGTEYLGPLVALSARYAGRGMSAKQIEATLRGFLDAVPEAARDVKDGGHAPGRWADRVKNLGRIARSAVAKFGPKTEEPPPEANGKAGDQTKEAPTEPVRAEIRLSDERWNAVMAECAGHLQDVVYLRDTMPTMLARAAEVGGKQVKDNDGDAVDLNGVRYRPGALLFIEALAARVAWHLDERVLFRRHVRRENEWVPTRCPKDLAASIVDTAVFLRFRACAGIVHVPLLAGGKLVTEPGYHAATGLILDLRGLRLDVPAAPDRKAAEKAIGRLLRPFRGYLMNGVADPTALLAAALTAVLRPSLPTCPGIVIDGNNPAVGKGKLARVFSTLNAGGVPAIVTEGHSPEETEKRLATAVIQGAPAILLDNLQRPLASSTLESMLTEPVADIRIFGRLGSLRVMCRSLLLLTANNATLRRDMLRRTLPLRIVVPDEKPELRKFGFDPVAEAAADRVELLTAAFTVVLAWLRVRDLPENKVFRRPLGSFEAWADLVAGAVAWLTGKNPIDLIDERGEQDPGIADERCIIEALAAKYGMAGWTARQAAKDLDRELWATVVRLKGEQPDAGSVGKWLRSRKDRVFGNLALTNEVDRKGIAKWQVRKAPGMPGMAGDSFTSNVRDGGDAKSREAGPNIPGEPRHPRRPTEVPPEAEAEEEGGYL